MNKATRVAEAVTTSLPTAASSMAGPSRISIVTRALLQNVGGEDVALAPNSRRPAHNAAPTIHNISIHRVGHIDRPSHTARAMPAAISVEPTSSRPAEPVPVEPACCPSAPSS
jgi:hypothetical protein